MSRPAPKPIALALGNKIGNLFNEISCCRLMINELLKKDHWTKDDAAMANMWKRDYNKAMDALMDLGVSMIDFRYTMD